MAGIKFEAEGYGEFKKSLREIQSSLKVVSSELQVTKSEFDKNDNSVAALTAKNKSLSNSIQEQKKYVDQLKQGVAAATKEWGENDKRTQALTVQYNKAQVELNNLEREFKDNEKAARDVSRGYDDAGNKLDEFGNIADKSDSKFEKLGGTLKGVGVAIGAAAVAAGTALAAASVSGAAYADDILTLSTQTGIATDKLQEYKYAAELVDVSTETLTKSMAKNIKSMKGVQDGTKLSVDAYNRLGISVLNADGSMRDSQTVYWETIDALGQIKNETERDALAMQIFGKSAQELNPLIEAGSERMLELAAKAQAAGYVLSEDTLEAFGAFDDQLQYLKVGAEAAKNALGTILLPVLTELATDGTSLLEEFTNGILDANGDIGQIGEAIGATLSSLVNKIVEKMPQIIEAGMGIIGALGQGLMNNLPAIITAAVQIITMLANGLINALPQLVDAALQIILALALGLADALPELIPAAVDAIITIVETLIDNIDLLIDAAIAIIMALADGLITALPRLIEKAPEIVINLLGALIENAPKILAAGIELIGKLIEGIWSVIASVVKAGADVVGKIGEGIKGAFDSVVQWGKDIIDKLMEGLKAAWESVVTWFDGVWNSLLGNRTANITVNKKVTGIDGSNAAGLDYVPFDGYISELHKGEMVIPANLANGLRNLGVTAKKQTDIAGLMASSVNAINMQGGGNQRITIEIPLSINGKEFYRASISDLWSVMSSNPRVVSDAI